MKRTNPSTIVVACAVLILATAASAYQINPMKNKYHGNRAPGGIWENVTETVHEDITDAAVHCEKVRRENPARASESCASIGLPVSRHSYGNKYDALIRGVWWNDDPNQLLFAYHYPTWVSYMHDAHRIASKGRNWLGRRTMINSTYKMQYRSHYGDLQFLHAMANDRDERAEDVRDRILTWIGFAYDVAIGRQDIEQTMSEISSPIASTYFVDQPGWTVNHLFDPKYTLGAATVPEVATGSILHVVQDSFSDAHVARTYDAVPECPAGRILQFHAYNQQDAKLHGVADRRAAWRGETRFTSTLSPVEASARLLAFVEDKADWDTVVLPYLKDTLFCVGRDATVSGPGPYE